MATVKQENIIKQIAEAGYVLKEKTEFSTLVWVSFERLWKTEKHPDGNVLLDEQIYGSIGPRGKLKLTYSQFNYRQPVKSPWELRNRLDESNWRNVTAPKPVTTGTT